MTTIVAYKRQLFFAITFIGLLHYYYRFTKYNINNNKVQSQKQGDSPSFLYPTKEAHPYVLDYNRNENDFTKSNTPTVIEFYDPHCGACQAFKYNYIEIAKKVMSQRPNVQFYGVSCKVYKSICDNYGVKRFPKILVFPERENRDGGGSRDAGIEVPKGTGTIYFLSARINKALRTTEEIEMDRVEASKLTDGT